MLLPRFPPLQSGAAFSSPAFSTPAVWCRVFHSRVFQSRVFSRSLEATYDDHLRLIGKRVEDFLLALIKLFLARCYGWNATCDYQLKISDFASTGVVWPKISGRREHLTTHVALSLPKLSCGVGSWRSQPWQFHQNRFRGFGFPRGRNLPFFYA